MEAVAKINKELYTIRKELEAYDAVKQFPIRSTRLQIHFRLTLTNYSMMLSLLPRVTTKRPC